MAKIDLVEEAEMNRSLDSEGLLGVRLVAELTDGGRKEFVVRQPKGHPEAPLTDAEMVQKISGLLEEVAPAHTPERLLDLCNRLATVDDVKQLIDTCNLTPT